MIKYRTELPALLKKLELPMIAAELGVAEGYNSADLLANGIEKLYMVDAWATLPGTGDRTNDQAWHDKNFTDALKRVSKYGENAIILRGKTTEMAELVPDNSLGLLYLDAGHDYESVMNDLVTWYPKVIKGGIIAGHDFLNPAYGVNQAVREFATSRVFTIHEQKMEDAGFLFIKP